MSTISRTIFLGLPLLISIVCTGCAVEDEDTVIDIDGKADVVEARGACENAFVQRDHEDVLSNEAPWDFDFCPEAQGLNLTNLHWMAYFAANEYAHAGYLLPQLDSLGFGSPAYPESHLDGEEWTGHEAEFLYDCVDSMYWLRCMEERVDSSQLWDNAIEWPHLCSQRWYRQTTEQPASLAATFEDWFIGSDHADWSIQFFSGGEFDRGFLEFNEGSTQMLWAEHSEMPLVVLAFRGTEPGTWSDALVDLHLFQEDFSNWGEVHTGFMGAFESVLDDRIEARLQFLADNVQDANIWITGHSLGGALATLMAATILERMERDPSWENLNLRGVVTFGSPRVGDGDFVFNFNQAVQARDVTVLRVVHGDDIVTNIPKDWPWIGLGYEHVGSTVYLGQEEDPDCCPADNPDCCVFDGDEEGSCPAPCLVYSPEELDIADVFGSAEDHYMRGYYDRIRALIDDPEMQQFVGCTAVE